MPHDQPEPALSGTLTVDAIEGGRARVELEDGHFEDWPLASLPHGVREGQVVRLHVEGGDLDMEIDHEATKARHQQAQKLLDDLNRPVQGGELDL